MRYVALAALFACGCGGKSAGSSLGVTTSEHGNPSLDGGANGATGGSPAAGSGGDANNPNNIPSQDDQGEDDAFVGTDPSVLRFEAIGTGRREFCGILRDGEADGRAWEAGSVVCVDGSDVSFSWPGTFDDIAFSDDAVPSDLMCAASPEQDLRCFGILMQGPPPGWRVAVSEFTACALTETGASCFIWKFPMGDWEPDVDASAEILAVAPGQICTADADGRTKCELSEGRPGAVVRAGSYSSLAMGSQLACGVERDGAVHCWEAETPTDTLEPTQLEGEFDPGRRALSMNLNDEGCALLTTGMVRCFGDSPGLRYVEMLAGPYLQVSLSTTQVCLLDVDGRVECYPLQG